MDNHLSEDERKALRAFQRIAQRLQNSNLVKKAPSRIRISRKFDGASGGCKDVVEGYEPDALQAQLPLLRQFILTRDKVELGRVLSLVRRRCQDEALRKRAKEVKKAWNQLLHEESKDTDLGIYGISGTLHEECLDLFYGADGLFHVDPSKDPPDQPDVFNGVKLRLYVRGLINCICETQWIVGSWLDVDSGSEEPLASTGERAIDSGESDD